MRAFAYHNLVRQYRKTYRLGHDGPGVPLVLEPPVGDPEIDSKPAGKLSDVFKQITDDLNWAIENLEVFSALLRVWLTKMLQKDC